MKTITISKPTVRTRGQGIPAGVKIVRNTLALLVTMKPRWLKAAARELMGDQKGYVRDLVVEVLAESR